MMKKIALGLLVLAPLSAPAVASPLDSQTATQTELRSLETASRMTPSDGGAAIELANAYYRAGRMGEAASVYRRALSLDNVMLETRTGDAIWSHEVARHALSQQTVISAR